MKRVVLAEKKQEGGCNINEGPGNLPTSSHCIYFSIKSRHCAQATKEVGCIPLRIVVDRFVSTTLDVIARTAIMLAARTLATRVLVGNHFKDLYLPIPWPLSVARYQHNQTPGGATEQPSKTMHLYYSQHNAQNPKERHQNYHHWQHELVHIKSTLVSLKFLDSNLLKTIMHTIFRWKIRVN